MVYASFSRQTGKICGQRMRTRLRSRIRSRWWDEEQAVVFFYCGQPRACFSCGKRYPVCFSLVCRWSEFFWWSFFSCVNVESLKFKELFKSFTPAQFAISKTSSFVIPWVLYCVSYFFIHSWRKPHLIPSLFRAWWPALFARQSCNAVSVVSWLRRSTPPEKSLLAHTLWLTRKGKSVFPSMKVNTVKTHVIVSIILYHSVILYSHSYLRLFSFVQE